MINRGPRNEEKLIDVIGGFMLLPPQAANYLTHAQGNTIRQIAGQSMLII